MKRVLNFMCNPKLAHILVLHVVKALLRGGYLFTAYNSTTVVRLSAPIFDNYNLPLPFSSQIIYILVSYLKFELLLFSDLFDMMFMILILFICI